MKNHCGMAAGSGTVDDSLLSARRSYVWYITYFVCCAGCLHLNYQASCD
jgi:hypothetical protein